MQYNIPDVATTGNFFGLASRADGILATVPSNISAVQTGGYYVSGDGGAGLFNKVAGPLTDGASFQSADGAWWQLAEKAPNARQFGAKGDGVTDDVTAINNMLAYCPAYSTCYLNGCNSIVGAQVTIPKDNITFDLCNGVIKAKAAINFEYVILATARTNVHVRNGTIDANKAGRTAGQNVRFNAIAYTTCIDSTITNIKAINCRGYNGTPAVGVTMAGQSIRCKAIDCIAQDNGSFGNIPSTDSDGFFASGEQNLIVGCIAKDCTDTGFVIESSNLSGISGCTSDTCAVGAGITNATASDKIGNFIAGLTVLNWRSFGGVVIGTVDGYTGNLYETNLSNISISADVVGGFGVGKGLRIKGNASGATGKTSGVTVTGVRVRSTTQQGISIEKNAEYVNITNSYVFNTVDGCIQIGDGVGHKITDNYLRGGGSFGIVLTGTAIAEANSNTIDGTSVGIGLLAATNTIYAYGNNMLALLGARWSVAGGATVNMTGAVGSNYQVNNAAGAVITGAITNKFQILDKDGTPLGYVPIYNI